MIGKHIRIARQRKGWNIAKAAEEAQVSRSALGMYETGDRQVPPDVLAELAKKLNAPELLIIADDPLNAVWLGKVSSPLETIAWLREEMREAMDALDTLEYELRRSYDDTRTIEKHVEQVYDLNTAVGMFIVSMVREAGVSLERVHDSHLQKVERYREKIRKAVEAA